MNRYFFQNGFIPQYNKIPELLYLMEDAIDLFNQQEVFLLKNDYHETAMAHRLALHIDDLIKLDSRFHDMYTDIEYNRGADGNTHAAKYLIDHNDNKHDIRLDLVVSGRFRDEQFGFQNLLCAEIKKQSNKRNNAWNEDRNRLKQLTAMDSQGTNRPLFGYFIGFFILVDSERMWIENAYDFIGEIPKLDGTRRLYAFDNRYDSYQYG